MHHMDIEKLKWRPLSGIRFFSELTNASITFSPTLCPRKLFEVLQQMAINQNSRTLVNIKITKHRFFGQIIKSP